MLKIFLQYYIPTIKLFAKTWNFIQNANLLIFKPLQYYIAPMYFCFYNSIAVSLQFTFNWKNNEIQ